MEAQGLILRDVLPLERIIQIREDELMQLIAVGIEQACERSKSCNQDVSPGVRNTSAAPVFLHDCGVDQVAGSVSADQGDTDKKSAMQVGPQRSQNRYQ